jgi:hypothetical protein
MNLVRRSRIQTERAHPGRSSSASSETPRIISNRALLRTRCGPAAAGPRSWNFAQTEKTFMDGNADGHGQEIQQDANHANLRELEGSRFLFAIIRAIRVEFGSVADP